jgi:hypothetical protein
MSIRSKLPLASAWVAAAILAAAVSDASARRFEVSEQQINSIFSALEQVRFSSETYAIECPLSLAGSFHSRTLSKVAGALIGYITNASVASECTPGGISGLAIVLNGVELVGEVRSPQTLPWGGCRSAYMHREAKNRCLR